MQRSPRRPRRPIPHRVRTPRLQVTWPRAAAPCHWNRPAARTPGVVVVTEAQARAAQLAAAIVEQFRGALPVIARKARAHALHVGAEGFALALRAEALRKRKHRHHHVGDAERVQIGGQPRQILVEARFAWFRHRVHVDAGELDVVARGRGAQLRGRLSVVAGEFDGAIADLRDPGERAIDVALRVVTHRVELQADGHVLACEPASRGASAAGMSAKRVARLPAKAPQSQVRLSIVSSRSA